jgi:GNAT superfamily N-acetyltransferase
MATPRPARLEDCEGVWRVFTRAVRELARDAYTPAQIEAWAALRQPANFAAAIGKREFYVAEDAGTIVAYAQLDIPAGLLEAVYVAPEFTGHGLGRQLMDLLEEKARAAGLKSLRLRASLNAVGFYERLGWQAGRRESHQLPGGVAFDIVHMTKPLAP